MALKINDLFKLQDKVIDYLGIKAKEFSRIKDPRAFGDENSFGRMSLSYQIGKALSYLIYEDPSVLGIALNGTNRLTFEVKYHGVNHQLEFDKGNADMTVYYDKRSNSDLEEYGSYTWVHMLPYIINEYMTSVSFRNKIKTLYSIKSFNDMQWDFLSASDDIYFAVKKNHCESIVYKSISDQEKDFTFDYKNLIYKEVSNNLDPSLNDADFDKLYNVSYTEFDDYLITEELVGKKSSTVVTKISTKLKKKKKKKTTIFDAAKINITKEEWSDREKAFISKDPGDLEVDKDKIALLNEAIKRRMSVLLIGDTGTGKTTLVEKLSYELQIPLYEVVASNDAESDLFIGKNTIEDGEVKFIPGQITKPLLNGGIALVDEFNAMNPGINIALHSVLDDRRRLEIIDYGKPIQAHDDFFFIATMNEGDIYSGVNRLNQATKRRFDLVLRFDYLSEDKEMEIIMAKAGGVRDERLARNIVGVLSLCRQSQKNNDLLNPADTGTGIKWYKFSQIIGAKKAAEVTLIETVADDDQETKLIKEHIRAYFG
jgi:MoxR-like ATPase